MPRHRRVIAVNGADQVVQCRIAKGVLGTREPLRILRFIFERRQVIAEAVPMLRILKHLEVIEDIMLWFFSVP